MSSTLTDAELEALKERARREIPVLRERVVVACANLRRIAEGK